MPLIKHTIIQLFKLLIFWILLFDFQRIIFSIHNWDKFVDVSWGDWLLTFIYSIRLDLATGAYLSALPLLVLVIRFLHPAKWNRTLFIGIVLFEALLASMIHSGEVNAYPEWNHKFNFSGIYAFV